MEGIALGMAQGLVKGRIVFVFFRLLRRIGDTKSVLGEAWSLT